MMRFVRRWPAVTLGAILTLALGVGISAAVAAFLRSMVAPPLRGEHARNLHRLVQLPAVKTYSAYRGLVERVRTLDMGVYHRVEAGIGRGSSAAPLRLECISHTYLGLLVCSPGDTQLNSPYTFPTE